MARTLATVLVAAAAASALAASAPRGDGVFALTPDTFSDFVDGSTPALVEFYAPWCGHCKNLEPEYTKVGDLYKRSDGVVVAKMDADAHGAFASKYGVTGFPTLKWFGDDVNNPEDYSGGRDADSIVSFINQRTGLKKHIPKEPTNVQHLTSSTFAGVVMDPTKSALVEFYAPWCGHCKALAPTYKQLADVYAGEDNVAIVAVDATENRDLAEQFGVKGYPTLKWFPAGEGKEATDYAGGRDLGSFVEFINEHAGTMRASDGSLLAEAGRVEALDELAKKFMAADAAGRTAVLETELPAAVAELDGTAAEAGVVYERVMKKVIAKGEGYVATEAARMAKLLAGKGVTPAKATRFAVKKNVLGAFAQ